MRPRYMSRVQPCFKYFLGCPHQTVPVLTQSLPMSESGSSVAAPGSAKKISSVLSSEIDHEKLCFENLCVSLRAARPVHSVSLRVLLVLSTARFLRQPLMPPLQCSESRSWHYQLGANGSKWGVRLISQSSRTACRTFADVAVSLADSCQPSYLLCQRRSHLGLCE